MRIVDVADVTVQGVEGSGVFDPIKVILSPIHTATAGGDKAGFGVAVIVGCATKFTEYVFVQPLSSS